MKIKKIYYLVYFLSFCVVGLTAQIDKTLYFNNLNIQGPNGKYVASSLGGLEAPSFNVYDLNKDGKKDLIIFDRAGSRTFTFINMGSKTKPNYTYKAEFEKLIPPIKGWFLMRDMNRDGNDDLVTLSNYESHGNSDALIYYSDNGVNQAKFGDAIYFYTKTSLSDSSLFSFNDITLPSITDIDNDGDLDVLDVNIFTGKAFFYKNYGVEKGKKHKTDYFKTFEYCWGNYAENLTLNEAILNPETCNPKNYFIRDTFPWLLKKEGEKLPKTNRQPNRRHAGGTSLLLLDKDNDQDYDLVMGNSGFENLIILINGKNNSTSIYDSIISQDTIFPRGSTPALIRSFPAAYYLDIDGDEVKDLVVASNQLADNAGKNNILYYKNIGQESNPNFKYQQNDFIQNKMLDLGSNSKPVFADIDNDGDKDMFISIRDNLKDGAGICRVYLYENTGSNTIPEFKEKDNDFAQLLNYKLPFLSLSLADIDGDNDLDMFIGAADGSIMYFSNTGTSKNATYSLIKKRWHKISVNSSATPTFYDVDGDKDLDLIIGQDDGMISFYKNEGTVAKENLQFITDQLGKMKTAPYVAQGPDTILSPLGSSTPSLSNFGSKNLYLISGNSYGEILAWKLDMDNPLDSFPKEKLNFKYKVWHNHYFDYKVKSSMLHTTVVDINGDGNDEIVAGSTAGGILYWSTNEPVTSIKNNYLNAKEYNMYPNPATNKLLFNGKTTIRKIEIYNLHGKVIKNLMTYNTQVQLDVSDLNNGTYLVKILGINNKSWSEPLIIYRGE